MSTDEAGLAGSGMSAAETTVIEEAESVMAVARIGRGAKVLAPVRSMAVGFRFKPPLRF
jgi:hypothetical protein